MVRITSRMIAVKVLPVVKNKTGHPMTLATKIDSRRQCHLLTITRIPKCLSGIVTIGSRFVQCAFGLA